MEFIGISLAKIYSESGWEYFPLLNLLMVGIIIGLLWLGRRRGELSFFLVALCLGGLLANLPKAGITDLIEYGVLQLFLLALHYQIFPPLFFLGLGMLLDFRFLLANRKLIFLGASFQVGIFFAFGVGLSVEFLSFGWLPNFSLAEAASIALVGTGFPVMALFVTSKSAYTLLSAVAVGAFLYSLFAQSIRKEFVGCLSTLPEEQYPLLQKREISASEGVAFRVLLLLGIGLTFPLVSPLLGMLILGNFLREVGSDYDRFSQVGKGIVDGMSVVIGLALGLTLEGNKFLDSSLVAILLIGAVGLAVGAFCEILTLKIINRLSQDKERLNPMILCGDDKVLFGASNPLERAQKTVLTVRILAVLIAGGILLSLTHTIIL